MCLLIQRVNVPRCYTNMGKTFYIYICSRVEYGYRPMVVGRVVHDHGTMKMYALSLFYFLIKEAFDALLRGLFKFFGIYLHF